MFTQFIKNKSSIYLIVFVCILVYSTGLNGPYLFDDNNNLSPLGYNGGVNTFLKLWTFVTSNESGPLGRPISMLSFALNAQNWPVQPFIFKLTNLVIHCANGLLVYFLLIKITKQLEIKNDLRNGIVFFSTAIWMLHPLNVSTVLYVIQRMTLLSTFFILAGALHYTHCLEKVALQSKLEYKKITFGLIFFGLLAIYSKEIGVLLPLYTFLISTTVLNKLPPNDKTWRYWNVCFSLLPYLILFGYFSLSPAIERAYGLRDFTLEERLLTQPRVLLDYLSQIVFPNISRMGIFHDNYKISTSFFEPKSTIVSFALILILVITSIAWRKTRSLVSFGILWFLGGHILESTVFPLEMYFEHRNYLPSLGPIFLLVSSIYIFSQKKEYMRKILVFMPVYLLLCAFITFLRVEKWSNAELLFISWAENNPNSDRAQQNIAEYLLFQKNKPIPASKYLYDNLKNSPDSVRVKVRLLLTQCFLERPLVEKEELTQGINTGLYEQGTASTLQQLGTLVASGKCKYLDSSFIIKVIEMLLNNKRLIARPEIIHYLKLQQAEQFLYLNKCNSVFSIITDKDIKEDPMAAVFLIKAYIQCNNRVSAKKELLNLIEATNHDNELTIPRIELEIESLKKQLLY